MSKSKDRIADLERQIELLRVQLDALRDSLADKITTRHLIVDNDDGATIELNVQGLVVVGGDSDSCAEIGPDHFAVRHDASGCGVTITARESEAEVRVSAGDVVAPSVDLMPDVQSVNVTATTDWDFDGGGPHAGVEVNCIELAPRQPAS